LALARGRPEILGGAEKNAFLTFRPPGSAGLQFRRSASPMDRPAKKDPDFDVRKNLIATWAMIGSAYQTAPAGKTLADLSSAPRFSCLPRLNPDQAGWRSKTLPRSAPRRKTRPRRANF